MAPPPAPHLVPAKTPPRTYEPAPSEVSEDDGEDRRAARTRMIAGGAAVVGAIVIAVVILTTGMFRKDRGSHASPSASVGTAVPDLGSVPQPSAPSANGAATTAVGEPTFGLQVASFRTAGRATRVLKDMTDLTHLPGQILTTEDPDGNTWFRIVLGRFATEAEAQRSAQDLVGRSLIPEAIVIPYTPQT
jgi:hypothetical protein